MDPQAVPRGFLRFYVLSLLSRRPEAGYSIMRTIEEQYGLDPVATRDAAVNDLGPAISAGRRGR